MKLVLLAKLPRPNELPRLPKKGMHLLVVVVDAVVAADAVTAVVDVITTPLTMTPSLHVVEEMRGVMATVAEAMMVLLVAVVVAESMIALLPEEEEVAVLAVKPVATTMTMAGVVDVVEAVEIHVVEAEQMKHHPVEDNPLDEEIVVEIVAEAAEAVAAVHPNPNKLLEPPGPRGVEHHARSEYFLPL